MQLTTTEIPTLDKQYRRNFFNTLPGPRGVHLIGTKGHKGVENLGLFSSVVHIGATPPLLGVIVRPLTVPRHTYHHIKAKGYYTLNTIHPEILRQAHQASAHYPIETSEFAATGLTPWYSDAIPVPYVAESLVKIGLKWVEEHTIAANGTLFLVGEVVEVLLPDDCVSDEGHVNHELLNTLTVSGLDTYFSVEQIARLPYANASSSAAGG
ncbi:MAG: flavin reductase [Saprospiraceae bacterium]